MKYLITSIIGLVVAVLILVSRNTFSQTDLQTIYKDLCDGFCVPGMLMLAFGALLFASNGGAFDMLKFGVLKLVDLFKRDMTNVKYRTFYEYRKAQQELQRDFVYILIVGAALMAIGIVFLVLFYSAEPAPQ